MVPKVGKDIVDVLDKTHDLITGFTAYKEEECDKQNEANGLIKFVEDLEHKEGSIFEDNIISKGVEKILSKYKHDNNFKENILIIDDLDRIDPEHIFRILNIFAAHFDRRGSHHSKNKFGFDKIILVCDIENIRNIFKAKFGGDTDFNGYIDKFYSYEIFNYSNKKAVLYFAMDMLYRAKWHYWDRAGFTSSENRVGEGQSNFYLRDNSFFVDVINVMFDFKQIDLRNIIKWNHLKIPLETYYEFDGVSLNSREYPIILSLVIFSKIKGGANSFKQAISKFAGKNIDFRFVHKYIEQMICIVTSPEHRFNNRELPVYHIGDMPIKLEIKDKKPFISHSTGQGLHFDDAHLFLMIEKTIDFLVSKDIL